MIIGCPGVLKGHETGFGLGSHRCRGSKAVFADCLGKRIYV